MDWLILIAFILIMFCIIPVMKKLDAFFELPTTHTEAAQEAYTEHVPKSPLAARRALIIGSTPLASQLACLLDSLQMKYRQLELQEALNCGELYSHLFAVSGDDYDNLTISRVGSRLFGSRYVVAVCNDRQNRFLFENSKVDCFSSEGLRAEELIRRTDIHTGGTANAC